MNYYLGATKILQKSPWNATIFMALRLEQDKLTTIGDWATTITQNNMESWKNVSRLVVEKVPHD